MNRANVCSINRLLLMFAMILGLSVAGAWVAVGSWFENPDSVTLPHEPYAFTFMNLNGDFLPDIAVVPWDLRYTHVLANGGSGDYTLDGSYPGFGGNAVASGCLNDDPWDDLVSDDQGSTLKIFLGPR